MDHVHVLQIQNHKETVSSSIYALPPPYTILISLTVRDNTHKASCNDRSASSKICCVAPRMTMLQASPKATPENLISYTHTQRQTLNKKTIFSANLVLTNHHLFYQLAMPKTGLPKVETISPPTCIGKYTCTVHVHCSVIVYGTYMQ